MTQDNTPGTVTNLMILAFVEGIAKSPQPFEKARPAIEAWLASNTRDFLERNDLLDLEAEAATIWETILRGGGVVDRESAIAWIDALLGEEP